MTTTQAQCIALIEKAFRGLVEAHARTCEPGYALFRAIVDVQTLILRSVQCADAPSREANAEMLRRLTEKVCREWLEQN